MKIDISIDRFEDWVITSIAQVMVMDIGMKEFGAEPIIQTHIIMSTILITPTVMDGELEMVTLEFGSDSKPDT